MNLILFDVSGTLVHSTDFENRVLWKTLASKLSIPERSVSEFRPEETETAFVLKVWERVNGGEPTKDEWDSIYHIYQSTLIEEYLKSDKRFTALEGAPELLSNLQNSHSWGFAIATTSWHDMAHMSLRGSGFYTRRFHVVTGEGIRKRTELLSKAIESSKRWYGVSSFDKVTYVGDAAHQGVTCREMNLSYLDVADVSASESKAAFRYPEKTQFIRLARRAVVPSRMKANTFGSLIGIKA